MMHIVSSSMPLPKRVEVILQDNEKEMIVQVDVRVMPNGRVLIEAEHLNGPDPENLGMTFILDDDGKSAYLYVPAR